MWDPDAGLVIPRSQTVAGKLVDAGEKTGKLKVFANTPAQSLIVEGGRIKGVVTHRGTIMADHVVVCAGLWGRLIAEMVGRGPAGHAGRSSADILRALQRVRGHRQGHRLSAAARPGQLGLYARHGRSEDRRGRADRVGLLRDRQSAPVPSARYPGKGTRRGCRPRSAISTWSRSSSRWNAPWN
jgi:hypothetical protein